MTCSCFSRSRGRRGAHGGVSPRARFAISAGVILGFIRSAIAMRRCSRRSCPCSSRSTWSCTSTSPPLAPPDAVARLQVARELACGVFVPGRCSRSRGAGASIRFHPWRRGCRTHSERSALPVLTSREEEIDSGDRGPARRHVTPHAHGSARESGRCGSCRSPIAHRSFMSVERLRRIAARAVSRKPDLVLLTGDFLTMESQGDPELLRRALEPLREMPAVFACSQPRSRSRGDGPTALTGSGVTLLVDEERSCRPSRAVQIVGMDFTWRESRRTSSASARASAAAGVTDRVAA